MSNALEFELLIICLKTTSNVRYLIVTPKVDILLHIAAKLNEYFSSISEIFRNNDASNLNTNLAKLKEFVNSKVPNGIFFQILLITPGQVSAIISALDPS